MRVLVDGHTLGSRLTGNECYVRNLLRELDRVAEPGVDLWVFVSNSGGLKWVPERCRVLRVHQNPFVRLGLQMPRFLVKERPDVLHVQYTAPLYCPVPIVVSVHDISFVDWPELLPRYRVLQLRSTVPATIRRAKAVVTVSEFSRQRILDAFPFAAGKVHVIPNAADPMFTPIPQERAQKEVEQRLGIPAPFILTVGDLQARKNQRRLVEAYAELRRMYPQLKHRLVLAGKPGYGAQEVLDTIKRHGLQGQVVVPGYTNDEDLLLLYNACDIFVFPSLYEGFGLPVLEAMACGRAVACSDAAALPEVADGAAIFFDPTSPAEIARAMRDLLLEPELKARMERLGRKRASQFSWRRAAEQLLDIYRQASNSAQTLGVLHGKAGFGARASS